jgi:peptidoglycan hydrolase-like protein with peptidoglycan-binding domain
MENFKFFIASVFILILLGLGGYWAFSTMESGSTHVDSQKQKALQDRNTELEKQVADLTRQVSLLQESNGEQVAKDKAVLDAQNLQPIAAPLKTTTQVKTTASTTPTPAKTTTYKYQTLINELQKLVDGNIYLKLKSQSPAVGTLQKFLNIYNNTSTKVDNDYGASTVTAIKNFQKAQGLTADGATGPSTYQKMISWLKTK